jgi:hypothetical protein
VDEAVQDPVEEPVELGGQVRGGRAALRHGGGEPGIPAGGEQFGQARSLRRGLSWIGNRGRLAGPAVPGRGIW